MSRPDEIEIQEPPIQQLQKNRSCFKRSCFGGCGCLFVFCVLSLVFLNIVAVPKQKELKQLPDTFPTSMIPIYDESNIDTITYLSAQKKNKSMERFAFIPKIILTPLYLTVEDYLPTNYQILSKTKGTKAWERFTAIVSAPIFSDTDTYTIHWSNLTARPSFILDYYKNELERSGFITSSTNSGVAQELTFNNTDQTLSGSLHIVDESFTDRGTDAILLEVSIKK